MHVLVVAATAAELGSLAPAAPPLGQPTPLPPLGGHSLTGVVTGVGPLAAAYSLAQALATEKYELLLGLGVAGSYRRHWPLATVVQVTEELWECGAENAPGQQPEVLTLAHLGLAAAGGAEGMVFNEYALGQPWPGPWPTARGLTVAVASGTPATVARRTALNCDAETLEGAALAHAALLSGTPAVSLRALSNYVEVRNRAAWLLAPALHALDAAARHFLADVLVHKP